MKRRLMAGALALSLVCVTAAKAQDDTAGLIAVLEEHLGQSMGEAVLGGQSVFVTARGTARIEAALPPPFTVEASAQADTAAEAAGLLDRKIQALRAAAKRLGVQITVGEFNYSLARQGPQPPRVVTSALAGGQVPPPPAIQIAPVRIAPGRSVTPAGPGRPQFTAHTQVHVSRPADAVMPQLLDAIHEAGVDAINDTNGPVNPFAGFTQSLGLGASASAGQVPESTWDRASQAAMRTARAEAEVLAAAAGRHVGEAKQVLQLSRQVQGEEASVSVAVRFGFAPAK